MAVVSSTSSKNVLIALNRMKILTYFDYVICGDAVTVGKPSPEGYLKALHYLGVKKEDGLIIEDSKNGIQAGKAAGVCVAAYKGTSHEQDTSAADMEFSAFHELEHLF